MRDPRLREYLRQISVGCNDAIEFASGMTFAEFLQDQKTQKAVAMCLVIIGEASKKIADRFPDFCDQHAEVAWVSIRGLRNRIAHEYFDLDFAVIWETLSSELPGLAASVADLIEAEG
jgi:uncharacterized protein with HEPN domain